MKGRGPGSFTFVAQGSKSGLLQSPSSVPGAVRGTDPSGTSLGTLSGYFFSKNIKSQPELFKTNEISNFSLVPPNGPWVILGLDPVRWTQSTLGPSEMRCFYRTDWRVAGVRAVKRCISWRVRKCLFFSKSGSCTPVKDCEGSPARNGTEICQVMVRKP